MVDYKHDIKYEIEEPDICKERAYLPRDFKANVDVLLIRRLEPACKCSMRA